MEPVTPVRRGPERPGGLLASTSPDSYAKTTGRARRASKTYSSSRGGVMFFADRVAAFTHIGGPR
ncbi:hypothetical protein [[Kitasatospora] papulosa]|uniref:hypothetical protein n=1 Tax=[Kitasatospora] papulosa TaxID=1464011 RepID=UPI0036C69DB2